MTLSPDVYKNRLGQMTQYIIQLGYEKAEELDTKTDEEFKIEKANIVHTSQVKINEEFAIQENQLLKEMKIYTWKVALQQKLQLLDTKHNHIEVLRTQVHQKITQDMTNIGHRSKILYLLILEGLYKLLEKNVTIRCKQCDVSIISGLLSFLQQEYQQHTKQNVLLMIDNQFIKNSILGGIYLLTRNNRILLENTLDSRVDNAICSRIPVLNNIWYKLPNRIQK